MVRIIETVIRINKQGGYLTKIHANYSGKFSYVLDIEKAKVFKSSVRLQKATDYLKSINEEYILVAMF